MDKRVQLTSPFGDYAPDYAEVKVRSSVRSFRAELTFTETYRRYQNAHVSLCEAKYLQVLAPTIFKEMRQGNLFAGRTAYRQVGFGLEQASGGPGF
jgi:hypothetical protein